MAGLTCKDFRDAVNELKANLQLEREIKRERFLRLFLDAQHTGWLEYPVSKMRRVEELRKWDTEA